MDSATFFMFLVSKLTLLLQLVRQLFLEQETPSGTAAVGDNCDVSRSVAAVDDEDVDDIAIAADWPLVLRHS
jgi:hypothetical protein